MLASVVISPVLCVMKIAEAMSQPTAGETATYLNPGLSSIKEDFIEAQAQRLASGKGIQDARTFIIGAYPDYVQATGRTEELWEIVIEYLDTSDAVSINIEDLAEEIQMDNEE